MTPVVSVNVRVRGKAPNDTGFTSSLVGDVPKSGPVGF